MMQRLVSIIMPFKNTDAFIGFCLTSIIQQTYSCWEAICIDDDSNDNSAAIVKTYNQKDSRIRYVKNEGTGIIPALQTGYKHCIGEYITRMDSDDIMVRTRLSVMVAQLNTMGKGHLAIGLVNYFRADGVSNGYLKYQNWINGLTLKGANFTEIYKECVVPSPCWMIHRGDFEACEGFSPNRYPEDYDLTFRFYRAKYTCIPTNKILLHWRDYSNRTSRTHEHYAQNYFLDIKTHYFLKLDYNPNRSLTLWGAGNKGKTIAKLLLQASVAFYWICDNPKKIGKTIYGQKLLGFNDLAELRNPQTIVTVANETSQKEIRDYFGLQNMTAMLDYFFFC